MTVDQLRQDQSYKPLLVLELDQLLGFVREHLRLNTVVSRFYFALNVAVLAALVFFGETDIQSGQIRWASLLQNFGLGTFLVVTVGIPLHEGLHGLAYKFAGAKKVTYGGNWRKFYFYAVADQFVVTRKRFIYIALAPFLIINLAALVAVFFVSTEITWLLFGVLWMHIVACAGDVALLSFYEQHRHYRELLTFDEVARKRSYFYVTYS